MAKLNVLRDYVEDYIAILCRQSFGAEIFKITLVDGFSGGGIYDGGKLGSPFVLLKAVEIAEARLNEPGRVKKIKIECDFHFVDESKEHVNCLKHEFEKSDYRSRLGKSIFLHQGKFEQKYPDIIDHIKKRHPKGGNRVIFFLDQCGYSDVHPSAIKKISAELNHKAEFIINYAIQWLEDFISDNNKFHAAFSKLGLEGWVSPEEIIRIKKDNNFHWKYLVESKIGPGLKAASGMPFFSPFYIEPVDSHRGYWLLHLAPHGRARSAMLDVYWSNANSHRHFGHAGFNMLAFKADADQTGYFAGMTFDETTRVMAKRKLSVDFARVIHEKHTGGLSYKDFISNYSNETIANQALTGEILADLAEAEELNITGPSGASKRSKAINPDDIIQPIRQMVFPAMAKKKI